MGTGSRGLKLGMLAIAFIGAASTANAGLSFFEEKDVALVEVKGRVHDEATGKPIAGAYVVAHWDGATSGFHGTFYHCLRIDAARTSSDGTFSFSAPEEAVYRKGMSQQSVEVSVYSPGLEERFDRKYMARSMRTFELEQSWLAKLSSPRRFAVELDAILFRSIEDRSDRLQTLRRVATQPIRDCETHGDESAVRAFFEAPAKEARLLARTKYERAVADALESDARMVFEDSSARFHASLNILLQAEKHPEIDDLDRRDDRDMTPLMLASKRGDWNLVSNLLAAGANPNRTRKVITESGQDSALAFAIPMDSRVMRALLADPRTDPDIRARPYFYTPLMTALRACRPDLVEMLLARGADPNASAYGQFSPLSVGIESMRTRIDGQPIATCSRQFSELLACNRLNRDAIIDGGTALIVSLVHGENDRARQILESGAGPNASDQASRTPLVAVTEAAILNPKHPEFVEGVRLMAAWPGVDHAVRYKGKTAYEMAVNAYRGDLVKILEPYAKKLDALKSRDK